MIMVMALAINNFEIALELYNNIQRKVISLWMLRFVGNAFYAH